MISRKQAGGLAVALCMCVLVPGQTFARGGGGGGGGGFGARGFAPRSLGTGFHAPALRPMARLHQHGFGAPAHRRAGLGFFPLSGFGGAYYGSGYGSSDYVGPQEQSVAPELETTGVPAGVFPGAGPVIVYRPPGCRTDTVAVPATAGGSRSVNVNITRC
jgi:hypothetical protein